MGNVTESFLHLLFLKLLKLKIQAFLILLHITDVVFLQLLPAKGLKLALLQLSGTKSIISLRYACVQYTRVLYFGVVCSDPHNLVY